MRVLAHIGYHKTGSSWLQHAVFEDPAGGYASVGHEAPTHPLRRIVSEHPFRYDAAAVRAELGALIAAVEERGLFPVVSLERLSGHPFTGGADSRQIADRLREALDDAGVLVVIREQRSMIVAVYKQYVKAGGTASLSQFLAPARDRANRANLFDLGYFEYEHLLAHYHGLFGPDGVLVLPYELLLRDGRSFVERIAAFTGRSFPEEFLARLPYTNRDNPSVSGLSIAALRQVNRFAPRTELNPGPALESRTAAWLTKRLKKPNVLERAQRAGAAADARLGRIVEETVGDRYADSNRVTTELTGLDLASLGWPVRADG
jgi:hypothetical protein